MIKKGSGTVLAVRSAKLNYATRDRFQPSGGMFKAFRLGASTSSAIGRERIPKRLS